MARTRCFHNIAHADLEPLSRTEVRVTLGGGEGCQSFDYSLDEQRVYVTG